jgi:hypothetical protein
MEKSILLHCLSTDEFKKLLKEIVKDAIAENREEHEEKKSEILLTRAEACEFLKIDSSTLWHWTKKGKIDCYGIGNRKYYKKEDLLKSLVLLKVKKDF